MITKHELRGPVAFATTKDTKDTKADCDERIVATIPRWSRTAMATNRRRPKKILWVVFVTSCFRGKNREIEGGLLPSLDNQ